MGRTTSIISRFPDFYKTRDVDNVFHRFVDVFGQILDQVESDLIKIMRNHWVDTADNEDSKGFDTTQKGDLDKIFSLYLENLGGTSQLKQGARRSGPDGLIDDAIYRERIKGLINVLKSGASTREGIITIVAANLGIVGDDDKAVNARKKIRIVEFLPEPFPINLGEKALFEKFVVENQNVIDATPEIRITIIEDLAVPLVKPRLVNLTTGRFIQYNGTVKGKDVLSFFPDGTAFLNGIVIPVEGTAPPLPPGKSNWRFEAAFGLAEGIFDQTLFDFSIFEKERLNSVGLFDLETSRFDEAVFDLEVPVVRLDLKLFKLSPASFMVRVPWDIPDYTERFDQFADNPRTQIKFIVDKVKAAGVFAVIAYEKRFDEEEQEMADSLTVQLPVREDHLIEESNFDIGSTQIAYPGGIEHGLSDNLVISGVFDFTRFDSMNTFN